MTGGGGVMMYPVCLAPTPAHLHHPHHMLMLVCLVVVDPLSSPSVPGHSATPSSAASDAASVEAAHRLGVEGAGRWLGAFDLLMPQRGGSLATMATDTLDSAGLANSSVVVTLTGAVVGAKK